MDQSSETWHDNAPMDILSADSRILSERARHAADALEGTIKFDYPNRDEITATLGSIVTYHFIEDPDEIETVYIAGRARELPTDIMSQVGATTLGGELGVVTLASPLGRALLGRVTDDVVRYNVSDRREMTVLIIGVEQFRPID